MTRTFFCSNVKITYDNKARAIYIKLKEGEHYRTEALAKGMIYVDYSFKEPIGIEVLLPSV